MKLNYPNWSVSMKNVLIIDDKQAVWTEAKDEFRGAGLILTLTRLSDAPIDYGQLSKYDKVIIHDHGEGGNSYTNRVEFEVLGRHVFERPIQIIVVNNDPEASLPDIRERWSRFRDYFKIQAFYRLPIDPDLILASINEEPGHSAYGSWLDKLRYPVRLLDPRRGLVLQTNNAWTWADNAPSLSESFMDRSVVIFPSTQDNTTYRIISSELDDELIIQSAFKMESPSQDINEIQQAIIRQMKEFGFLRSRLYLIRSVPGGYPFLELMSCYGSEIPDDDRVKRYRLESGVNVGMSENKNVCLELDQHGAALLHRVCGDAKSEPVLARASKAYETESNTGIRQLHEILNISESAEVLYLSFYTSDGRLRGILAADSGNTYLQKYATLNFRRNMEIVQRLLNSFSEALVGEEKKTRVDLSQNSRAALNEINASSSKDNFALTARSFLRQSFEIFPVSLGVLAWTKGEGLAPFIVAVEMLEDKYSIDEVQRLKGLELTVASSAELPAVNQAAQTGKDSYYLSGLDKKKHPDDLNKHRPRLAFPLMLGGKMRGVVGFSVPQGHSRLFSNDLEQLKTIWELATPTLFYLDQIKSYAERIDITRHDIANTVDNVSTLLADVDNELIRELAIDELSDLVGLDSFLATSDAGTITTTEFSPATIVNELFGFFARVAEPQRKKFVSDGLQLNATVVGDPGLYRSAARNLMKNAITHGKRVGRPDWLTVKISLKLGHEAVDLEVLNPGHLDSEPPDAVAGYRKGSQRALKILAKMLQPYHASIELDETVIDGVDCVCARLRWPTKENLIE